MRSVYLSNTDYKVTDRLSPINHSHMKHNYYPILGFSWRPTSLLTWKLYIFGYWLHGYDSLFIYEWILCIQNGSMVVGCCMKNTMSASYNKWDGGHNHKKLHCNKCNVWKLRVKDPLVNDTLATCHDKWYIFMKILPKQIACNLCMIASVPREKYICGLFY